MATFGTTLFSGIAILKSAMMFLLMALHVTPLPIPPEGTPSFNEHAQSKTVHRYPLSESAKSLADVMKRLHNLQIVSRNINDHVTDNAYNFRDNMKYNPGTSHYHDTKMQNVKRHNSGIIHNGGIVQRLVTPCMGGTARSAKVHPAHIQPHNLTPRDYIQGLSHDSMATSRHVAGIRKQYKETMLAGIPPSTTSIFYSEQLGARREVLKQARTAEKSLMVVYIELARLGHDLSQVLVWQPSTRGTTITSSLDHIVEGVVLNLLCGVKVVLGSLKTPESSILEEIVQMESLPVPESTALRYLAVYELLYQLELLLQDVSVLLGALGV